MIFLSLNIRGVEGPLKYASMRRVLSITLSDIMFLQETLVDAQKVRSFMYSLHPDWFICVVRSVGKSGGLLVAWDPLTFDLTAT